MSKTLPPLAASVLVGSTAYRAGDIPPIKHARKITNKRNWEGGVVPNFNDYEDGAETVDGIGNADAVNAGRTGLPGFNSDGTPKQLVTETTGQGNQLITRTGGEGAGTGDSGNQGAGDGDGGQGDGDGDGDVVTGGDGGAISPAAMPGAETGTGGRARKQAKPAAPAQP